LFRNTVGVAFRAGASVAFGLFATGVAATPAAAQAAGGSAGQLVLLQVLVAVFALAALSILVWAIRCRRRGRFFARLFASMPDPQLAVDRDGKRVAATSSWIRLLGEDDAPIKALAALAASDGADGKARFDALLTSLAEGRPARADFRLGLPDMEFVELSAVSPGGDTDFVVWRLEDVSERYEFERSNRNE